MAHAIPASKVVHYAAEALRSFFIYGFEWIDNLLFLQDPEVFVGADAGKYLDIAKERFLEFGWEGDGVIQLLWLPPFVFPVGLNVPPEGVALWHVKQEEDGVSYLLSPIPLPFEEFSGARQ
ncbi:hypothetical protein [Roseateles sp.]|uniref:hypothetical protein n=1 Tax=Roseateles sp. TaxID=1971397 RepID=UPI0032632F51